MLSSITPLGERSRGNRWWWTVTVFVASSVLGGALTGALLGGIGWLLYGVLPSAAVLPAVLAGAAAVALLFDGAHRRLDLPRSRRQVNEDWIGTYRAWVYAAGWGLQLGLGWATVVTAATTYVLFVAMLAVADPVWAAAAGAVFGLTRGLTLLTARRVDSTERLVAYHRRLQAVLPVAQRGAALADAVVLVLAVAALVTVA